jgi:hypothetical protein
VSASNADSGEDHGERRSQQARGADQELGAWDVGIVSRWRIGTIAEPCIGNKDVLCPDWAD